MDSSPRTVEDYEARSAFMRELILAPHRSTPPPPATPRPIPRTIIHFWHDLDMLPDDVRECIASWESLARDYTLHLYDSAMARSFILSRLGARFAGAFDRCYHPAMQSDYFRLCYILIAGGCYVDVDDCYSGADISSIFHAGGLALQPLCYDIPSDSMVPPTAFYVLDSDPSRRIYYFNNNPLIASPSHAVIARALLQATELLELAPASTLPEIQSTTGPGNLTKAIHDAGRLSPTDLSSLHILREWAHIAPTRWPLGYRHDARNWRRSNRVRFSQLPPHR